MQNWKWRKPIPTKFFWRKICIHFTYSLYNCWNSGIIFLEWLSSNFKENLRLTSFRTIFRAIAQLQESGVSNIQNSHIYSDNHSHIMKGSNSAMRLWITKWLYIFWTPFQISINPDSDVSNNIWKDFRNHPVDLWGKPEISFQ